MRSDPGIRLLLDSLEDKRLGSEVIAVRYESDGSEKATIHVPKDKLPKFAQKFEDYAHKDHPKWGNPLNQKLVESISEIRLAMLRDGDYWTDSGPLPGTDEEFWWEVWLRDEGGIQLPNSRSLPVESVFREEAAQLGIRVSDREVRFPDLVVVLAYTSLSRWSEFTGLLRIWPSSGGRASSQESSSSFPLRGKPSLSTRCLRGRPLPVKTHRPSASSIAA